VEELDKYICILVPSDVEDALRLEIEMNDHELVAALEDGTLAEGEFGHRNHVRTAYTYIRELGFSEAIGRMSRSLRNYVAARGKEDRYHETITVAFLAIINERVARSGDGGGWEGFAEANPDLLDKRFLSHYYRPKTLNSSFARKTFVLGEFRSAPYPDERQSGAAPTP
jgi:hypothetical protein